jgi:hypothetical protein
MVGANVATHSCLDLTQILIPPYHFGTCMREKRTIVLTIWLGNTSLWLKRQHMTRT